MDKQTGSGKNTFPVGENVTRVDALDKVTGEAKFADDLAFGPDMLYGRVLRSPHPHALIKSVDVSQALGMKGAAIRLLNEDNETLSLVASPP